MNFELLHPAEQLTMIMDRIYDYGMTTTSGGNLSIMDEEGNMWITPAGIDKGSLTLNDIVCVKADGTIEGSHKPSSEYPFHQWIYKARPDIKAIVHAHPPALVAFSIVRRIPMTNLLPNTDLICGGVKMAEYGLPGSEDLGEKIAKEFAKGSNTILLENHGIVVGSKNLFAAFMSFETFDFLARLEIDAKCIGKPSELSQEMLTISRSKDFAGLKEMDTTTHSPRERNARREMCQLIHRAYNQKLFTSTQGTFSQKLDDDSFIITPYGVDRKYLDVGDIVKIENGKKEKGKLPSRSVLLHKMIYAKHPEIKSLIIAHPPKIMAFAVTDEDFDSRTIPESYILLRKIPKLPFGTNINNPDLIVQTMNKDVPIVMIKNDSVIVSGNSLLNAYDRLEVLEYSAKAIIASRSLGEVVKISDADILDLIKAFNL